MYRDRIFEFTQKLIKRYRTSNPYDIAEILGIKIDYKHFSSLKGMYFVVERCAFITLSDTLDETMEKIVLFHEIGHHLLHRHLAAKSFQELDCTICPRSLKWKQIFLRRICSSTMTNWTLLHEIIILQHRLPVCYTFHTKCF